MTQVSIHLIRSFTRDPGAVKTVRGMAALVGLLGAAGMAASPSDTIQEPAAALFDTYCFSCHDEDEKKGGLDLSAALRNGDFDGHWAFENLITGKMPTSNKKQPASAEKAAMLEWLAARQPAVPAHDFRRISRHEFVTTVNDLLGTGMDLAGKIPEDRGTYDFDTDRRIQLTSEQLAAAFTVADEMLDFALPTDHVAPERGWTTRAVKESHESYRIYARKHDEGMLFSWTRSNNGSFYSFFYDNFEPPVTGWYELTFDAAKMGDFPEDISIMVFAGKYFIADDRPQPQRLLGVISLGGKTLHAHTVKAFLNPGENVSVHCYSPHTWRQTKGEQGAYIKQLAVRGPVQDAWPPKSYQTIFPGLPTTPPKRPTSSDAPAITVSGGEADLRAVIKRFAERAFVSTLSDAELAPYLQVSLDRLKAGDSFVAAAKVGMKAVISSPRFYLTPGPSTNPSQTRAASLSRALWLSVPDSRLAGLAAADRLTGPLLREEIQRMLADPKSRRMIHSFCGQWLNLRSLNKVSPSLKLYPLFDELLNHYLPLETEAYVAHLIESDLPVTYLIDSDFTFLNQRLAGHYGIEGVIGQQLRKVGLPAGSPRGGLMTMASILKVTADGFQTSPILRGAWVSKNIVGTALSPPPPNVGTIEADHAASRTLKEQIEEHKKNKSCYACHKSIDPYGFALENFDAAGQWRTRYATEQPHAGTFIYRPDGYFKPAGKVDASAEINDTVFNDVIGLKKFLSADHKRIAYNVAKKFFEYTVGRKPDLKQRLDLWAMIPDKAEDCGIRELLVGVLAYSTDGQQPNGNDNP
jgi:mono/diheme cytochrome c family protein